MGIVQIASSKIEQNDNRLLDRVNWKAQSRPRTKTGTFSEKVLLRKSTSQKNALNHDQPTRLFSMTRTPWLHQQVFNSFLLSQKRITHTSGRLVMYLRCVFMAAVKSLHWVSLQSRKSACVICKQEKTNIHLPGIRGLYYGSQNFNRRKIQVAFCTERIFRFSLYTEKWGQNKQPQ